MYNRDLADLLRTRFQVLFHETIREYGLPDYLGVICPQNGWRLAVVDRIPSIYGEVAKIVYCNLFDSWIAFPASIDIDLSQGVCPVIVENSIRLVTAGGTNPVAKVTLRGVELNPLYEGSSMVLVILQLPKLFEVTCRLLWGDDEYGLAKALYSVGWRAEKRDGSSFYSLQGFDGTAVVSLQTQLIESKAISYVCEMMGLPYTPYVVDVLLVLRNMSK